METQHHSQKMVPKDAQSQNFGPWKYSFLSSRGSFPDQWDSAFICLVGNLLEVVVSVRPGFHFIGVAGGLVSGQ